MAQEKAAITRQGLMLGIISLVAGALGWFASLRLFLDYVGSLKSADFVPSCDLSSQVSCAQNYSSSYGSILGFSNTVIGLSLFIIPLLMGVLILAGTAIPRWIQNGYSIGLFGAVLFISYLQWASFTQLQTLCLYCLLIWTVVIFLFWSALGSSLRRAPADDRLPKSSSMGMISSAIASSWWLFALVHFTLVLAAGEFSMGAIGALVEIVLS